MLLATRSGSGGYGRLTWTQDVNTPSVSCPHILHFHLAPPASHVHHGLMYPLHRSHRAGPICPVSTRGTCSSRGSWSAKGWIIAAIGTSQSEARRDVLGMFQVVMRTYRGDELPGQDRSTFLVRKHRGTYLGPLPRSPSWKAVDACRAMSYTAHPPISPGRFRWCLLAKGFGLGRWRHASLCMECQRCAVVEECES